ncbi:MAG: putative zinc-binding metallopeptidase [Alistipes sp.]|nr:putative zinc-binding metallopeptidase [Alistipes sp.]
MKKSLLYIALLGISALFCACAEDDLSSESVIKESINAETDFDRWLEDNYRAPFNIRFLYRYEDIETNLNYDLTPARELYARILAKAVRYLWLDLYTEQSDVHFMREHSPRVIMVIGSGAHDPTAGTVTLGTAEGGLKITLYVGNWLENYVTINYNNGVDETDGYTVSIKSVDDFNYYYLHTIHHEFAHILHQKKEYPQDFNVISKGDYSAQWTSVSDQEAARLGFITPYASSATHEDFVEVYSNYLSMNDAQWNQRLQMAGSVGADRIQRKLAIVKTYMKEVWDIDVEAMRASLARRYNDIEHIDWSNFN